MYLVRTEEIRAGMRLGKTIATPTGKALLTAGTALKESYIQPLLNQGVWSVYVINELAPDVNPEDVVSETTRRAVAKELGAVLDQVATVFQEASRKRVLQFTVGIDGERLKEAVGKVVDDILNNPGVVYNLKDIRSADEYTLGHCVNVCLLSTLLGTVMGYNTTELKDLAIGALLHDIGKVATPPEILNKPGPLTTEEFEIMSQHTTIGWMMLKDQRTIRYTSAIVALQHHERWAGGGYPKGLREEQIYRHSRICAIADCFDAMTSDRVYRKGMSPAKALQTILNGMNGYFQPGLAWSFCQCIAPYPVGSMVELSDGSQAVVVNVQRGKTFQPRIRVLMDRGGRELAGQFELETEEHPEIQIVRMLREESPEFSPGLVEQMDPVAE
ncbi:MAG: HD-GYP domain-containing protein [Mycobacterium leprae]